MNARNATLAIVLTAAVTASLSGCRPDDAQAQPIGTCTECTPAPTASPTSTMLDAAAKEKQDRQDAEAVWRKFDGLIRTLESLPADQVNAAVAAVAVEPTHSRMLKENADFRAEGKASYGQTISYISWPQPINGQDTAVLKDCQDGSQAGVLDTKTGNKLTVGTVNTPIRGTLTRTPAGWRVAAAELLGGTTCTPGQ